MAVEIVMPRLSDSMEEGTILKWLKSEGDQVERGEDLVEIESDKANMTYASDTAGVLTKIIAKEGETLPVGEPIALVDGGAGAPAPKVTKKEEVEEAPAAASEAEAKDTVIEKPPAAPGPARIKASPVARRLAAQLQVDIASLQGTGPEGRIVKADVESAATARPKTKAAVAAPEAPPEPAAPAPSAPSTAPPAAAAPTAKGEVELVELTRSQKTVVRRMSESKATAPHFYLEVDVDMGEAAAMRDKLKQIASAESLPSYNDMIVKATALALHEFPRANGAYRDGRVELYSRVNIGVAVATDDSLIVPTVFDADKKSLGEIAAETSVLVEKARSGQVTPPELSGGTFTITNLGMFGIDSFAAVINPPQAAILAVGAIKKRPVIDAGGGIAVRESMAMTLSCDHRILYGADAARFLSRIKEILEEPAALTL